MNKHLRRERIGLDWKARCDAIDVFFDEVWHIDEPYSDHWKCKSEVSHTDVWIAADPTFKYGTRIRIYTNGRIEKITSRPDEGDDAFLMKEAEK